MLYILAIIWVMVWNTAMCVGLLIYNYASDFRNMLDWMRAMVEVGGLWALYTWVEEEVHSAWQYELVAAWCLVKWFQAMYALRGFDLFGPRILPILRAVKDTAAFMVVMLFNLFGFTHAYYVLGRRDGPNLFYASLLPTFRLGVMGDFDTFELEGEPRDPDPSSNPLYNHVHTWFLLTSIVSAVMMMNLLVGILGSNYERFEEQSQALFVRERARIITLQSLRPYPWVRWVWRRLEMEDGHLYFTTKETPDTEEERSTRKAMQLLIMEPLKKQIESLDRKVGKAVLTSTSQIEHLQQQIEQLRKQNEQLQKQNESSEAKVDQMIQILKSLKFD